MGRRITRASRATVASERDSEPSLREGGLAEQLSVPEVVRLREEALNSFRSSPVVEEVRSLCVSTSPSQRRRRSYSRSRVASASKITLPQRFAFSPLVSFSTRFAFSTPVSFSTRFTLSLPVSFSTRFAFSPPFSFSTRFAFSLPSLLSCSTVS